MKNWKAICGICLVFVIGMAAGGLLTGIVIRHRIQRVIYGGAPAVAGVIVKRLDHRLNLDASQRDRARQIVLAAADQMREARKKVQPEVTIAMLTARDQIRALLTPEQARKFDEMAARTAALADRLK